MINNIFEEIRAERKRQEVENPADYCPSCQKKFDAACDRYRAMRKSVEGKDYKTQLEAINRFRSGM